MTLLVLVALRLVRGGGGVLAIDDSGGRVRARGGGSSDEGQNPEPPGGPRRVWWLPWHVGELRCAWGGRWYVFWSLLVGWSARPAREAGGAAPRAH